MISLKRKVSDSPDSNHDVSRPRIKNEQDRLDTFVKSSSKLNHNRSKFALCGFIFLKNGQCECQFCLVVIDDWNLHDDPLKEHMKHSPNCPLLTDFTDNEPISILKFNEMIERSKKIYRVKRGIHNNIKKLHSYSETNFTNNAPLNEPEHPTYRLKNERMNSYKDWPLTQLTQKAADLSDAGFFYTGTGDRVICFQCGGGLKNWDRDDVPWEQHALWYYECEYLKLRKGLDYINKIIEMHNGNVAKSETTVVENNLRLKEISEDKLCRICSDKEYNAAFIPCGHVVTCYDCASRLPACPICRQKNKFIKIFLG